jgi:hypothetical protein
MLTAEEMEPAGHAHVNAGRLWGAASPPPSWPRWPYWPASGRCAVPSVHPRAGPGCATRSRPGRARAVAMIAARHRSPSAPT